MATINSLVQGTKSAYRLVKELGRGGEGTVYTTNDPDLVIKIYKNPTDVMERKLQCMIRNPLKARADGEHLLIAWPQDVIYENGVFIGYAMPLVRSTYPIYIVGRNNEKHVKDCHEVFPLYDWRYSLMVAYHLAWTVSYIHSHGHIIGDLNSNNIVVHGDGTITLLDVDSFDITDPVTKERFPCNVGIGEFLPPELQGRDLRRSSFTKHSDEFALAVHIFILLMNNTHPFTLRNLTQEERISQNVQALFHEKRSTVQDQKMVNIVNGYCPFVRNVEGYGIPWPAPHLDMLPHNIQDAFRATFGYDETNAMARSTQRTTADEWRVLLYQYFLRSKGPNADMVRCSRNEEHFYLKSRGKCELCAAENRYREFLSYRGGRQSSSGNSYPQVPVSRQPSNSYSQAPVSRQSSNFTPAVSPWKVQILCHTDAATVNSGSMELYEGNYVFVHFKVTDGIAGQKSPFYYDWKDPYGRQPEGLRFSDHTHTVGECGYIGYLTAAKGTHTVTILDSERRPVAQHTFTVVSKPVNQPSPWKVQILCHNDAANTLDNSGRVSPGGRVFVHFKITDGIPGLQSRFFYDWKDPYGKEPEGLRIRNGSHTVGDQGFIGYLNAAPGTHSLTIMDGARRPVAQYSFTVSGQAVSQPSNWKVQIICHNDAANTLDNSGQVCEGGRVFVHFRVSDGIPGQQSRFFYDWKDPYGREPEGLRICNGSHAVGDYGFIGYLNAAAGTHTVTILDSNRRPLAQHTFTVGSQPVIQPASWNVQILCHTDSALDYDYDINPVAGGYAFVHFLVTDGDPNGCVRLLYTWEANGKPVSFRPSELQSVYSVGQQGWISNLEVPPGNHIVTIYDDQQRPLAQHSFQVAPKKGLMNRLFGR